LAAALLGGLVVALPGQFGPKLRGNALDGPGADRDTG
jgi:hypothetical protein